MISSEVKDWARFGIIILLLIIFPLGRVSGTSMTPSYQNNDLIIAQRFISNLERGDVVICVKEIDGVRRRIIKRVVGVPGDEIIELNGMLLINGVYFSTTNYYVERNYRLDEDQYFIMGDNEYNSLDSRSFGPVNIDDIKSKVLIKTEGLKLGSIWEFLD